jgi:acylaminoacyl-peptidase
VAFTRTTAERPADVALLEPGGSPRILTALNDDLAAQRVLASAHEFVVRSSHDGREIQAWVVMPPHFDPARRHPLLLEIHGGPFADYGVRFAYEFQAYAARGYVVLYANPRGSTGYGEEFGNLIHHAYPGHDYDDLMSCVDDLLARGLVDPERLYVTGGSGGGVLTAWIVGKNQRFRAAVSAKPVIDWTSHVLTADAYPFFVRYWFPAPPWEEPEEYFRRSPLALVGNVTTPTMLLTGEQDWRTPISQAEEYYQALKLRGVDTALVRIPDSSHGLADRPSQLMSKVLHVLAWFERYGGPPAVAGQ